MKVYYVDREYQGPETENPLLINGEHKTWDVKTLTHRADLTSMADGKRHSCTFQGWLHYLKVYRPYVESVYVYDIICRERFFCLYGCKPNTGDGCKNKYVEDNFVLSISCYFEINEEKRKEYKLKCKQLEFDFDDYFSLFKTD